MRVRLFSKILARRASNLCPFNPVQRAFIPADGVAENAFLLDAIMRKTEHERHPMAVVWIDVAKAFDSISHDYRQRCGANWHAATDCGRNPRDVQWVHD